MRYELKEANQAATNKRVAFDLAEDLTKSARKIGETLALEFPGLSERALQEIAETLAERLTDDDGLSDLLLGEETWRGVPEERSPWGLIEAGLEHGFNSIQSAQRAA